MCLAGVDLAPTGAERPAAARGGQHEEAQAGTFAATRTEHARPEVVFHGVSGDSAGKGENVEAVVPGAGLEPARVAPGDFRTLHGFRRRCGPAHRGPLAFGVWTFSSPCRARRGLGGGRQVSTPSGRSPKRQWARPAWLGIATGAEQLPPAEVSPNLTPFIPCVSTRALNRRSSPLCLPFHHPGGASQMAGRCGVYLGCGAAIDALAVLSVLCRTECAAGRAIAL